MALRALSGGWAGTVRSTESIIFLAKEWGQDPTSCDHLFLELVKSNKVLWVSSIATRNPNLASARDWRRAFQKVRRCLGGLKQVAPSGWVYQPMFVPFPYSRTARFVNRHLLRWSIGRQARRLGMKEPQLWMLQPNGAFLAGQLDESVVVYYCVDNWKEFAHLDGQAVASLERELVRTADVCFVSSEPLLEKLSENPNTHLSLHGVDHAAFSRALDPSFPVPAEIGGLAHPVIGFFGGIKAHIDVPLIASIAEARPQWNFVLVGAVEIDVAPLSSLPNVHLLGRRPYPTLPNFCRAFDVGIIPYRANEFIRHVNPIKLRQYLSAGLPVVSTPMPEVQRYAQSVEIAGDPRQFIAGIEKVLAEDSPASRAARSRAMESETWEARTAKVMALVLEAKSRRRSHNQSELCYRVTYPNV